MFTNAAKQMTKEKKYQIKNKVVKKRKKFKN